jgi:hypothetical protein
MTVIKREATMGEWHWIVAVVVALFLWAPGGLLGAQMLLKIGPVEMDWRDILALFLIVILGIAYFNGELSAKQIAAIIGGILVGKFGGMAVTRFRG